MDDTRKIQIVEDLKVKISLEHENFPIRVGSRKSELALIQTKSVISRLQKLYPSKIFEIHTMSTMGDRVLNISLPKIGEKSLFTRDLEDGLRNGSLDFVVHSLKDLPTMLPDGMAIGAVLEREDARDALVLNKNLKGKTLNTLQKGSIIGTSSLRRTAQIRRQYPHLTICDIRGNLNTRLAKLDAPDSKFAGIVLAQAGLVRMGWMNRISQILEPTDLLYAVGQGALAVECRSNDKDLLDMLKSLMCLQTTCRILAERSFLKTLGGGCSAPVAVWSTLKGSMPNESKISNSEVCLKLTGAVWSLDGITEVRGELFSCIAMKKNLGKKNRESENDYSGPSEKRVRRNSLKNSNSPIVFDDDISMGDFSNAKDIQHIIDIHGELFKKCPYSAMHIKNRQNDSFNNNEGRFKDECPLKIPVGQDFMGQCPYVGMEVKVISSKETKFSMSSASVYIPDPTKELKDDPSKLTNLTDHKSCPFLQKTIKMFDHTDEDKPQSSKALQALKHDLENLYCGLYRHDCYESDLFIKSFSLGQNLAEDLINKGALEVMKCAQQEIHSKT